MRLIVDMQERTVSFGTKIYIPPRGGVEVYFRGDEVRRLKEKKNTYVQMRSTVNLFVSVAYNKPVKSV